jgi:hypothetical protein
MILALCAAPLAADLALTARRYDVEVTGDFADIVITETFRAGGGAPADATYVTRLPVDAALVAMTAHTGDRDVAIDASIDGNTDVLTRRLVDVRPAADVVVTLHLLEPVASLDGTSELRLPLTHAPRLFTRDAAGALPRAPDADIRVAIDVGAGLSAIASPSHPSAKILTDETGAAVIVDSAASDRDFVLRWSVDAPGLESRPTLSTR